MACSTSVNAKRRFVSEKENLLVKNVYGASSENKLEWKRECGRVICLQKISKPAMGDTISINSERMLICLLSFLEAVQ